MLEGLTDKQRKAVLHYVENGNKIAAYRYAFDTNSGYATVASGAYKLFKQEKIREAIEDLTEALGVMEEDIINEGVSDRVHTLLRETASKRAYERLEEVDSILMKARKLLRDKAIA